MKRYFCYPTLVLLASVICFPSANARNDDWDSGVALSPIQGDVQNLQAKIMQNLQKNTEYLKKHVSDLISRETFIFVSHVNPPDVQMPDTPTRLPLYRHTLPNVQAPRTQTIISELRVIPDKTKTNVYVDCKFVTDIRDSLQLTGFLVEERKILSVKGNANRNISEDRDIKGSSYAPLFVLFDRQYEKCFDYRLIGIGKIKKRNVYALEIIQKESDIATEIFTDYTFSSGMTRNTSWDNKFDGVAFVDAETMEIVRLDRMPVYKKMKYDRDFITTDPMTGSEIGRRRIFEEAFTIQYEYDKVKITDRFLTLPVAKIVKNHDVGDALNVGGIFKKPKEPKEPKKNLYPITTYTFRYSDYRMFEVDTTIKYGAIEELSTEVPDSHGSDQ